MDEFSDEAREQVERARQSTGIFLRAGEGILSPGVVRVHNNTNKPERVERPKES